MAKVYVTREIPGNAVKMFQDKGYDVEVNPDDKVVDREVLLEKVKGCDGILSLLNDKMDAEVMDIAGPQLKVISNYAVGYNNIDLKAAEERRILVTNTPGVLTSATADTGIALMFSVARRIAEADRYTRAGKFDGWAPNMFLGMQVTGKTLGIVGCGRIGQDLALKMHKGFGMDIIYSDRSNKEEFEKETGARRVELDELCGSADFICISTVYVPETHHLIDESKFDLMKPTAIIFNIARGPIIKEKALVEALRDKKIFGAGLDVYENEPKLEPGLAELDNVVLLPHIGSAEQAVREEMGNIAARNLIAALEGQKPEFLVNEDVQ